MKIVHLTTVPQTLGYFLRGHIRFAKLHGAEVHVISSPGARLEQFARDESVHAHGVYMGRSISPVRDTRSLLAVRRRLASIRPDVVHAHTPKAGLLGMLAATSVRVGGRVYHLHGLPLVTATGLKRTILRACDKVACRIATSVYAVSPSLREVAIQEGVCAPTKLSVLGSGSICGVDARRTYNPDLMDDITTRSVRTRLHIDPDAVVIGFVGRIVRDKGIEDLVAAWSGLRERYSNLHLLVVGPFEARDSVSRDTKDTLEADPRVHLTGHVTEMAPCYAAMDILAFPTHREGFGQVALEASAMRLPVVATEIPGCVDAVRHGMTGTLVPPKCPSELAAAIERYVNDSELRGQHAAAGRWYALREFAPETLYRLLWQEYAELTGQTTETDAAARRAA